LNAAVLLDGCLLERVHFAFEACELSCIPLSRPTKNAAGQNTTMATPVTTESFVAWLS
jgi:hypothetical protein